MSGNGEGGPEEGSNRQAAEKCHEGVANLWRASRKASCKKLGDGIAPSTLAFSMPNRFR